MIGSIYFHKQMKPGLIILLTIEKLQSALLQASYFIKPLLAVVPYPLSPYCSLLDIVVRKS